MNPVCCFSLKFLCFTELNSEGEAVEDGECEANMAQPKYNMDKLIDYPGFNVPMPEGVKDVSKLGYIC